MPLVRDNRVKTISPSFAAQSVTRIFLLLHNKLASKRKRDESKVQNAWSDNSRCTSTTNSRVVTGRAMHRYERAASTCDIERALERESERRYVQE